MNSTLEVVESVGEGGRARSSSNKDVEHSGRWNQVMPIRLSLSGKNLRKERLQARLRYTVPESVFYLKTVAES